MIMEDVKWGANRGVLLTWLIEPGCVVNKGDILAKTNILDFELISHVTGTMSISRVPKNSKIKPKYVSMHQTSFKRSINCTSSLICMSFNDF
jgi:hypothetical protein